MEDGLKISELTQATLINNTDIIPIVQSNETKYVEVEDLFDYSKPSILYDNPSGSNSTITLNDSVANYNFIEIYFKSDDGYVKSTKIFGDTTYAELTVIQPLTSAENGMYIKTRIITLNTTTISTTRDGNNNYLAKAMYVTTSGTAQLDANYIYITKVLGYK